MKMEIRLALWIKRIVTRHRFGGVFSLRMCRDRAKILAVLAMSLMLMSPLTAYAVGEGNLDGGGGSMGQGTSQNKWTPGMEGVRVTVILADTRTPVTQPIDFTNKRPTNIQLHFGKVSKLSYNKGTALSASGEAYTFINPGQSLPRIISSQSLGAASIEAIKSYFTDEQVIRSIANLTGMDFEVLTNGKYKLMLEPIAYVVFQGVNVAMTATEAALYDQTINGAMRAMLPTVAFQNLPLSMFLETADLGYPAWSGPKSGVRSNQEIITSLGLGIVRFNEITTPPAVDAFDYEYRVNTEVITAVTVRGGQSDPDHPVSVTFRVAGKTMRVDHVYYPEGDSQIAWIRWTTPSTPQTMTIHVTVSGGGRTDKNTITANIVDLSKNPPPDPNADDRNDGFTIPTVPGREQVTRADWGVWRPWWYSYWVWHSGDDDDDGYWCDHGWWEFDYDRYHARLTAEMEIHPDEKSPTASGNTLKSGYGIQEIVTAGVSTNQSHAVTEAQNAITYFPEFDYQSYWRVLERMGRGYQTRFEFEENPFSTYERRTHFLPIWYPDGSYTPYTWLIDCWTPAGMLSMNLTDSVRVQGNLWQDWHISPQKPR